MGYWCNVGIEAIKLAFQFGGALLIALITVRLALSRYKREKHWERKLQAYSDVLAALGTMNQIINQWIRDEMRERTQPELEDKHVQRYASAMQKIEETAAVAALVLGPEVDQLIKNFLTEVHRAVKNDKRSWLSSLEEELSILQKAHVALLKAGKRDLGLS